MKATIRFPCFRGVARPVRAWCLAVLALAPVFLAGPTPARARTPVHEGAVATVHAVATRAAVEAFAAGGNAVDAAVAAALMLGVVDGENSGIGGGCFALVRLPDGRVLALDGRETAPARATADLYVRDGRAVPELSRTGALAVGVPGELATLDWLTRRYGRLPLRHALRAAAEVAEAGFVVTEPYARRLREETANLRRFSDSAAIFLHPDGEPYRAGEVLRQPDLARTYRAIADHGTRWFYRGEFARRTESWMQANGGLLDRGDFRRYTVRRREPVRSVYGDAEIVGFPPPSSGGVHVAQVLNLLDRCDYRQSPPGSASGAHLLAEALKLAFADRSYWLGDPDFTAVPRGLAGGAYADRLVRRIAPDHAGEVRDHDEPPEAATDVFGRHTTHLSTADDAGYWVALTATINTTFGAKVVVPGTGVVLNNQMDDFSAQPGATNAFGLLGAQANAIAPGKRPLSSMSPTFVLHRGRPILGVGAAGGPTIISQTVQAILGVVDHHRSLPDALAAPRLHHQWRPDELTLEEGWGEGVETALRQRGHAVRRVRTLGATQAVGHIAEVWSAAADPRVEGAAAVWRATDER